MFKPADLFDLSQTAHAELFSGVAYGWEVLPRIAAYVMARVPTGTTPRRVGGTYIGPQVLLGEGTEVEDGAVIQGPAIIGRNCQIRHNAYIRQHVIVGDECVVGNATELKNAVLFNQATAPHFNYVGDSILGHAVHLGAGAILSNLRAFPGNVTVELEGRPFDTGLRKFGALVGDGAEIGCHAVLNPGSIIGRGAVVYPGVNWRGFLPPNLIAKNKAAIEVVVRRPRETV